MIPFDPPLAIAIALAFLLAGVVKGVLGMGLPTVAIGLLGLLMPPVQAAAILIIPSILTNIRQLAPVRLLPARLDRLWPLLLGLCAGVAFGGLALNQIEAGGTTRLLGLLLMVYAAIGLASVRLAVPARIERPLSPAIGAATGVIASGTGVFLIPMVPWLQATGLERDDLVQSLGVAFVVSTVALGVLLGTSGVLDARMAVISLAAVLPAMLGQAIGQRLRSRIPPNRFRRWFLIALLVLGGQLAVG